MTRHIVDQLIEERATGLMTRPLLWQSVKTVFYPVLGYRRALAMADAIAEMSGREVFDHLSDSLRLETDVGGLEHVPRSGPAIVTPNHPAGIADGIAVYDALKQVRCDITFFANRDAIRVAPRLSELIVPVEWVETRRTRERTRETVRGMAKAFRAERLVVIFPSGRLARPTWRGLVEREWMPTAVSLAQKYNCRVIPLNIRGRNSALYYVLYFINDELRDMTLFRELLNKAGQRYELRFGEPWGEDRLAGDAQVISDRIREFVEAM